MINKEKIKEILGLAIGQASMLWSETPKGVFESSRALRLCNETYEAIVNEYMNDARPTEPYSVNLTRKSYRDLIALYPMSQMSIEQSFPEWLEIQLFGDERK